MRAFFVVVVNCEQPRLFVFAVETVVGVGGHALVGFRTHKRKNEVSVQVLNIALLSEARNGSGMLMCVTHNHLSCMLRVSSSGKA